jgi:hypothetical protein
VQRVVAHVPFAGHAAGALRAPVVLGLAGLLLLGLALRRRPTAVTA